MRASLASDSWARTARETTDPAWPRIVTGVARMSKDVAMVGAAVGLTVGRLPGVGSFPITVAPSVPVATFLVYAACVDIVPQGVTSSVAGALDATDDTRWPFYGRAIGMFGVVILLTYLGATTSLGLFGLALSFLGETLVPAAVSYYRFGTGEWKRISRDYRPGGTAGDD